MYNLFEDEDDIFSGSPRSKFIDVIYNANRDLCANELERLMERLSTLEMIVQEQLGLDSDKAVNDVYFSRGEEVAAATKNNYMISVGRILTQNE
ncbi:MAG: DUF2018 family protein [Campylobacterales bacterium]|nr:DUF2018 family protein [Campylobacterales bacterium]